MVNNNVISTRTYGVGKEFKNHDAEVRVLYSSAFAACYVG
jgi:hypothetical protein